MGSRPKIDNALFKFACLFEKAADVYPKDFYDLLLALQSDHAIDKKTCQLIT